MKKIKILISLLLLTAFVTSCDKESLTIEENSEAYSKITKENLNARLFQDFYGDELYALPRYGGDDIQRYNYDPSSDYLDFNDYYGSTGMDSNYGFDYNKTDGLIYLLAGQNYWESSRGEDGGGYRNLYIWDKDTNTNTLIEKIVSVKGNERPQDLTFGSDGTLYFVFTGGEVNSYNVSTKTMSAFMNLSRSDGAVGLTYDFDNNRLIYATGAYPRYFYSVDLPSGTETFLFSGYDGERCGDYKNSIEYVGNNKLISFGLWGCNTGAIHTINLNTEEYNFIGYSNLYSTKDLMFFVNPDRDGDGILNEDDPYPNSNMSATIEIDGCYSEIENVFVEPGTTMMDQIDELITEINEQYDGENWDYLHRRFTRKLSGITYYWRRDRIITRGERNDIIDCATNSEIPYFYE